MRANFSVTLSTCWSSGPTGIEPARCRLLFLLGEAQRQIHDFSCLRSQRWSRRANTAEALGLPEVQAHAALAYELSYGASAYAVDPPPRLLLQAGIAGASRRRGRDPTHVAGALARALLHSGALEEAKAQASLRASRWHGELGDPAALATNLSYLSDFGWGPDQTEEALDMRRRDDCRGQRCDNMEAASRGARPGGWRFILELGNIAVADAETRCVDAHRSASPISQRIRLAALGWHAMLADAAGPDSPTRSVSFFDKLSCCDAARTASAYSGIYKRCRSLRCGREQGRLTELAPVVAAFVSNTRPPGLAAGIGADVSGTRPSGGRAERSSSSSRRDAFADLPRDGRWLLLHGLL